jgi:hypothetical protein
VQARGARRHTTRAIIRRAAARARYTRARRSSSPALPPPSQAVTTRRRRRRPRRPPAHPAAHSACPHTDAAAACRWPSVGKRLRRVHARRGGDCWGPQPVAPTEAGQKQDDDDSSNSLHLCYSSLHLGPLAAPTHPPRHPPRTGLLAGYARVVGKDKRVALARRCWHRGGRPGNGARGRGVDRRKHGEHGVEARRVEQRQREAQQVARHELAWRARRQREAALPLLLAGGKGEVPLPRGRPARNPAPPCRRLSRPSTRAARRRRRTRALGSTARRQRQRQQGHGGKPPGVRAAAARTLAPERVGELPQNPSGAEEVGDRRYRGQDARFRQAGQHVAPVPPGPTPPQAARMRGKQLLACRRPTRVSQAPGQSVRVCELASWRVGDEAGPCGRRGRPPHAPQTGTASSLPSSCAPEKWRGSAPRRTWSQ